MKKSKRFSTKYAIGFFKKLAFLLEANIPIHESLKIILEEKSEFQDSISKIIIEVENGKKLHESLESTHSFSDKSSLELIRSGEENSMLSRNLKLCSQILEKREENKNLILGALLYPIIILVGTLGLTWFLIGYIFPKIKTVLLSMNANLPITTRMLIAISDFMVRFWIWIIVFIFIISLIIYFVLKRYFQAKKLLYLILIKLPIISGIINKNEYCKVYLSISTILSSGGKLDRSIVFAKDNARNIIHRQHWEQILSEIRQGKNLHKAMENKLFPSFDIGFIKSAERSGRLAEALAELSLMYEKDLKNTITNLTKLFEPAIMVILGIVVGFVAISIISPMYEITQSISIR